MSAPIANTTHEDVSPGDRKAMTRACASCMWWTRHASGPFGDCRGAPPTVTEHGYAFPQTYQDTWCAAWRVVEPLSTSRDETRRNPGSTAGE